MKPRDKTTLRKIMRHCRELESTHDYFKKDLALFLDEKNGFIYRNSVTMPILQIGELTKNLSEEFLNNNPQIPWRLIMRMRDIVAHHYGSLDYEVVWHTSVVDVPKLHMQISEIVADDID